MTLNATGPISLAGTTAGQSIEIELGGTGTTQISLNCTSVRTLAGVPSGAIIMPTNFYGKANQFNYTISSNQTNFCMRAGAVSAGWDQSSKLAVTINSGVVLSANSTGVFGMYIQGSFPGGVSLTNNGTIVGVGGNGGGGGSANAYGGGGTNGATGAAAGPGLYIRSNITICNASGVIAGGGGGGGGGASGYHCAGCCGCYYVGGGGAGGGRSSNVTNASGASGGSAINNGSNFGSPGATGGAGTYSSQGSGGSGGNVRSVTFGGAGGSGGTWGALGGSGGTTSGTNANSSPGSGGAGGAATCGTGYVTWTSTGTRYGAIN